MYRYYVHSLLCTLAVVLSKQPLSHRRYTSAKLSLFGKIIYAETVTQVLEDGLAVSDMRALLQALGARCGQGKAKILINLLADV